MPRPINLPKDFHIYNYTNLYKNESNPRNKIRLLAMAHIKDGVGLQDTARVIKTPWKTIQGWLYNFRKKGITSLYMKTTKHKPSKITTEIRDWIDSFVKALYSDQVGGSITGKELLI